MRPPRWEYRTITFEVSGFFGPKVKTDEVDAALNAHGHEGWELVSMFDVNGGHGRTSGIVAVFKRTRD